MAMKSLALILVFSLVGMTGCDRDTVERLKSENLQLRQENTRLTAEASNLTKALTQTKATLGSVTTQLSRKPLMPIKIAFRKAMTGPGYVAVLATTQKQDLQVFVTIKSKALGTEKKWTLNISQSTNLELGYREGASLFPGDRVTVENLQFEPIIGFCR